jgi:hypothetical protein
MLKDMWEKLDTYTCRAGDPSSARPVNVRNEWGGFSKKLKMPVFTGWQDLISTNSGQMRCQISDQAWTNKAGVNNQEFWVAHALENGGEAAFFVIKAVDPTMVPRKVEWLDDTRVLIGQIERVGTATFILAKRTLGI